MSRLILIASILLLQIPSRIAQSEKSQTEPYGFRDLQLGMSIAEFETKHPAPKVERYGPPASPLPGQALCAGPTMGEQKKALEDAVKSVVRCDYKETILGIPVRISAMFVDGKLAVIEVAPPVDSSSCFDPPPPGTSALYFYSAACQKYPPFFQALTEKLGSATIIPSSKNDPVHKEQIHALRWQSDVSVAEFQNHMCGPWDGTDNGWSKAISEVLEGRYCGNGDSLSYRQNMMLYLDKELSRTLAMRLRT
jgi:hypothetical protein